MIQFWILMFGCLLLVFGCAKKPPHGKALPRPKQPAVSKPAPQPVPLPQMPESLNPKRDASQKIVHLGEEYLEKGESDKAIRTFQEAINVDNENGVAYFFLAKALSQKEAYDDALGLLERAETLLSKDLDWTNEILKLKMSIEEAKTAPPPKQPTGQEVYY